VAGDHTRTISVAAPTVGGLMKFAVKTQTCLGCKTPLPKGTFPPLRVFFVWGPNGFRSQRRGMPKLSPSCWRIVPKTSHFDQRIRDALLAIVDSMSTMSRLVTSGCHLHVLGLSHLLPSYQSSEGSRVSSPRPRTLRYGMVGPCGGNIDEQGEY
jgi:hypothetical protein